MLTRCMSLLTRCRRSPLVLELPLWLTVGWSWLVNRAVRPERSSRLLSNVHVDNKNSWTAQTAEFVDNRFTPRYLSSFASCYKSHRLPTCLRPVHYVVLIHDFNVSFKILPLLSRISFGCRPMTWWYFDSIHSKTVFAMQASARPLIDANDLR